MRQIDSHTFTDPFGNMIVIVLMQNEVSEITCRMISGKADEWLNTTIRRAMMHGSKLNRLQAQSFFPAHDADIHERWKNN